MAKGLCASICGSGGPLTDLLSRRKLQWTEGTECAFRKLKDVMSQPLRLSRPDLTRPFVLQTDASSVGMGAVLFQVRPDGGRDIISCASAKFKTHERKYHCNEQEVLAVVWACKRYRSYLEDRHFTLRTDSRVLQWLNKYHQEKAKLTRYALLQQEFNFTVIHCAGDNQLPDFLSRHPGSEEMSVDEDRLVPPSVAEVPKEQATPIVNAVRPVGTKVRGNRRRKRVAEVPLAFVRPVQVNNVTNAEI